MKICAVVIDYFGSEMTVAALSSLVGQKIAWFVVVGNSNNDAANDELQGSVNKLFSNRGINNYEFIINDQNLGFASGINYAINRVEENQSFESYLVMNNDTIASPDLVGCLEKEMISNHKVALVSPSILAPDGCDTSLYYNRYSGIQTKRKLVGSFKYLSGCCLLINRKLISGNVFDPEFFMYGEDVDLSWRVRLLGFYIAQIESTSVVHQGSASSKVGSDFYELHVIRGHILLSDKLNSGALLKAISKIITLIFLMFRGLYRSSKYKKITPLISIFKSLIK